MRLIKALFFLLLFISFQGLFAQTFHIGMLAGVNTSQVSGDGYSGFNKAGILVGGYANLALNERTRLQFEINYSQKGSRRNPDTENGDTEFFLLRLDYIEVPIMASWELNKFTFEAGAYLGQLVNEYLEDENGIFDVPPEINQFKSIDMGGLVGINFKFTETLIMNWRYNNSLIPVREHDSGEQFRFNSGMFHSYFSFTLRYEFIGSNES